MWPSIASWWEVENSLFHLLLLHNLVFFIIIYLFVFICFLIKWLLPLTSKFLLFSCSPPISFLPWPCLAEEGEWAYGCVVLSCLAVLNHNLQLDRIPWKGEQFSDSLHANFWCYYIPTITSIWMNCGRWWSAVWHAVLMTYSKATADAPFAFTVREELRCQLMGRNHLG